MRPLKINTLFAFFSSQACLFLLAPGNVACFPRPFVSPQAGFSPPSRLFFPQAGCFPPQEADKIFRPRQASTKQFVFPPWRVVSPPPPRGRPYFSSQVGLSPPRRLLFPQAGCLPRALRVSRRGSARGLSLAGPLAVALPGAFPGTLPRALPGALPGSLAGPLAGGSPKISHPE